LLVNANIEIEPFDGRGPVSVEPAPPPPTVIVYEVFGVTS
jgi:hypothetical protein